MFHNQGSDNVPSDGYREFRLLTTNSGWPDRGIAFGARVVCSANQPVRQGSAPFLPDWGEESGGSSTFPFLDLLTHGLFYH